MMWVLIAVMTAAALALLLPPLLRRAPALRERAAFDMEIYRDQIAEIDRDLERGVITERESNDARIEISRRLLAADRQLTGAAPEAGEDETPAPARDGRAGKSAAAIAVMVPVAALAVYFAVGSPDIPVARPGDHTIAGKADNLASPEMVALIAKLGQRLKERPDDARGWALYARSLAGIGRTRAALDAFRRAAALDPKDTETLSRFAELQILDAKGTVTPEARRTLEAIVELQPGEPRARYYIGLAEQQAGRSAKALELWLTLEADSPPGAPWRKLLNERINKLAKQSNVSSEALAARREKLGSRPAPEDPGAMIHAMVDRLAKRLEKEPDDSDGWRRLARSYRVLGEKVKARDALAHAAKLLPDDVAVLTDYAVAIVAAGERSDKLSGELNRVTGEILKHNRDHPAALWYGGVGRMQEGDTAGALKLWKRLRDLLKPGTPQYDDLARRIDRLEKAPEK
ncbi:MAG: c-type cytochrome biogenesis protein CcmI [Alphaproteobacteria bacterium]